MEPEAEARSRAREWDSPRYLELASHLDDRGAIAFAQNSTLPFDICRVYFIFDVKTGSIRGSHAHKTLQQVIISVSGSVNVHLDDGKGGKVSFTLSDPRKGIYVPSGHWRTLSNFASGTVIAVLASDSFAEADYIRDYEEFLAWRKTR